MNSEASAQGGSASQSKRTEVFAVDVCSLLFGLAEAVSFSYSSPNKFCAHLTYQGGAGNTHPSLYGDWRSSILRPGQKTKNKVSSIYNPSLALVVNVLPNHKTVKDRQ